MCDAQNGVSCDSSYIQLYAFPDGSTRDAQQQAVVAHSLFLPDPDLTYQLPDFGVDPSDVDAFQSSFNGSFAPIEVVDLDTTSASSGQLDNNALLESFATPCSWPACDSLVYAAGDATATSQKVGVSYYSYLSQPQDGQSYAWVRLKCCLMIYHFLLCIYVYFKLSVKRGSEFY